MYKFRHLFYVIILFGINGIVHARQKKVTNPFFVFNNGISDTSEYKLPEKQIQLAAQIGFDGVEKNRLGIDK